MGANADRNRDLKARTLPVAVFTAAVVAAMPCAVLAERITDYAPFIYDTEFRDGPASRGRYQLTD